MQATIPTLAEYILINYEGIRVLIGWIPLVTGESLVINIRIGLN